MDVDKDIIETSFAQLVIGVLGIIKDHAMVVDIHHANVIATGSYRILRFEYGGNVSLVMKNTLYHGVIQDPVFCLLRGTTNESGIRKSVRRYYEDIVRFMNALKDNGVECSCSCANLERIVKESVAGNAYIAWNL